MQAERAYAAQLRSLGAALLLWAVVIMFTVLFSFLSMILRSNEDV